MKSVINCAIVVSLTMWATCTWGDQPQGWDDSPMGMLYQARELLKGERLGSGNRDKVKHDYGGAIALLNEIVIKTAGVVSNQAARAEALNLLAYCHLEGLGVEKDQMKAVSYFEESGKLGKCYALSDAAMCYALGVGVKKDEKKAFALIRQAVHDGENEREGSPDNFEIHMFKLAKDSRRNFTLAFEAKNNLGLCYLKGIGCEKDVERAKDVLGVQELKFASAAEGLAAAYCLSQLDNAKDPRVVDAILMEGVKEIVKLHTGDVNRFWGTCEWIRMFVVPCEEMLASMRSYGDGADMQLCVRKYAGDHVERDAGDEALKAGFEEQIGSDAKRLAEMQEICGEQQPGTVPVAPVASTPIRSYAPSQLPRTLTQEQVGAPDGKRKKAKDRLYSDEESERIWQQNYADYWKSHIAQKRSAWRR